MIELEIADYIAEKAKRDPRIQSILSDVRAFEGLQEQPGWRRLYERIVEKKETFTQSVARRLMAGEQISEKEIAYNKGFIMGATWIISHPVEAEKSLESAAKMAYALAESDLFDQTEEEEFLPYG